MASTGNMNMELVIKARDEASKAITELNKVIAGLDSTASKTTKNMEQSFGTNLPNAIREVGKYLWAAYLGSKLLESGKGALILAWNFEQAEVAFSTMLWSASDAQKLLSELSDFAAKTPFELTWIRQTAKQLLAMWISAKEVIPTLKSLGDVSAWLSVPLEQIAYAYGQVRSANQLYGTELRQFMNAWVPILSELAKMFWVTEAAAKKMVEEWKVGFDDVKKAFENMSWEGGKFFNLMDKQSKTYVGMLSNLRDAVDKLWERFGKPLLDPAKDSLQKITNLLKSVSDNQILFTSTVVSSIVKSFESLVNIVWKTIWLIATSLGWFTQLFSVAMNQVWVSNSETITTISWGWKDMFMYLAFWIQGIMLS